MVARQAAHLAARQVAGSACGLIASAAQAQDPRMVRSG
jgi:hypothetical protein